MDEIKLSLAAARVNAKLTQKDAASALHVSKATIVNWEVGKVKPSFIALQALSFLYKVPIECFFLP